MRLLPIIACLALSSCGTSNSLAATETAAKSAVEREFGTDAVIASRVLNSVNGSAVMCGYVAAAGTPVFPTATFIWTAERFDVSRWNDPQYARFDRRAHEICGANWVQPRRIPALS